jgi:hypothetical protein
MGNLLFHAPTAVRDRPVAVRTRTGEKIYIPAEEYHDRGDPVVQAARMARLPGGVTRLMHCPWYVQAVAKACIDGRVCIQRERPRTDGLPAFFDLARLTCTLRTAREFKPSRRAVATSTLDLDADGDVVEKYKGWWTGDEAEASIALEDMVGPSIRAALHARQQSSSLAELATSVLWDPAHVYTPTDDNVPHMACATINATPVRFALAIEEDFRAHFRARLLLEPW